MSHRLRVTRALRRPLMACSGLALVVFAAWQTGVAMQTSAKPPMKTGEVVQLDAAEARRVAQETRQSMPIQLAEGLEVSVWAPKSLVADALALDIDVNGVAY